MKASQLLHIEYKSGLNNHFTENFVLHDCTVYFIQLLITVPPNFFYFPCSKEIGLKNLRVQEI